MHEFDELDNGNRDTSKRPPALPPEAQLEDVIEAVNRLAASSRTHSVELEGIRLAVQAQGTNIETTLRGALQRIETALGIARTRQTDPAPPPAEGE